MANKTPSRKVPQSFYQLLEFFAREDNRIGQMMSNLFDFIKSKGKDPFYMENHQLMTMWLQYIHETYGDSYYENLKGKIGK